jgi:hypothetical protein
MFAIAMIPLPARAGLFGPALGVWFFGALLPAALWLQRALARDPVSRRQLRFRNSPNEGGFLVFAASLHRRLSGYSQG